MATMRKWVAAIVRKGPDLLMIKQRGVTDPTAYWYIPSGIVEAGESLLEGLRRELREETGLEIEGEPQVAYETSFGSAFEVPGASGEIRCDDPDGLVSEAGFVPFEDALKRLRRMPDSAMRNELLAYLERPGSPPR